MTDVDVKSGADKGGTGDDSPDTIFGQVDDDLIYGEDGDDVIDGGNDDDEISGQDGEDDINGGFGEDVIMGGNDNDRIDGDSGTGTDGDNDVLYGDSGDDFVFGNGGDDIIYGRTGDDNLFGDNGSDTTIFDGVGGAESTTVGDTIDDAGSGAFQLKTVPVGGADKVALEFDEAVDVVPTVKGRESAAGVLLFRRRMGAGFSLRTVRNKLDMFLPIGPNEPYIPGTSRMMAG